MRFPRVIGLTGEQQAEVARRVRDRDDYFERRNCADAAHAGMHAAQEAFEQAQEDVDRMWVEEVNRLVEELDP